MKRFVFPSYLVVAAVSLLGEIDGFAEIKLPAIISDHMVLQSDVAAPIWGWANPGEKVSVKIAGQTKEATADAGGKWSLKLDPIKSGGPFDLTVAGSTMVTVNDVLVGEVWIGSGQSNMSFPFPKVKDYAKEKAAANFPEIRMFNVINAEPAVSPQDDCKGAWHVTTPESVDSFSAPLYFFGRDLHQTLNVPVGLIKSAVGGTPIELWIDEKVQRDDPDLKKFFTIEEDEKAKFDPVAAQAKFKKWVAQDEAAAKLSGAPVRKRTDPLLVEKRNTSIGGLFNSKIAPLIPYAIRGVVWYQGENNASKAEFAPFYQYQLPLLVGDWRKRWGYDFPFAWVQLANLDVKTGNWPLVREAMLKSLRLPKTGMAVTIDIGEAHNIHFTDKQDVGHRLALWALGAVYGKGNAISGPLVSGSKTKDAQITLSFTHVDGGLVAKDGTLRGFVIAGTDKDWKPAVARIEGDTVIVFSPDVKAPTAVRYGWAANPDCNLYNGAGLPASPFRTDDNAVETASATTDEASPDAGNP